MVPGYNQQLNRKTAYLLVYCADVSLLTCVSNCKPVIGNQFWR